jgi:poly(hydroxyalkanoate) depolymerase family esterase
MMRSLFFLFSFFISADAWSKRLRFVHQGREFVLVTPQKTMTNPSLVVVLHGCRQTPDSFLDGSLLEDEVEKNKFLILAPEQPAFANYEKCWNWFLTIHQVRNPLNEMGQIISATKLVASRYKVDPNKVFVAGMSAGGAMAHNLAVCYPDVFSAAAIHSGVTYKAAETIDEAETVLTSTNQKTPEYLGKKMAFCAPSVRHRLKKILIIHGASDQFVPLFHSQLMSDAQKVWSDYLDDGMRNSSSKPIIKSETLVYPNNYFVHSTEARFSSFTEKQLVVRPLNHAWGGGRSLTKFFDPKAPSSNQFILNFFGITK